MVVECATKGLIVNSGKFLAIKQKVGNREFWDLPGGRMEFGLTPKQNLMKEIKEEIFLDVDVKRVVGTWQFFKKNKNQVVCITYLCKPRTTNVDITKNPQEDENITEYKWVTPEEFLSDEYEVWSDDFKGLIREFFEERKGE